MPNCKNCGEPIEWDYALMPDGNCIKLPFNIGADETHECQEKYPPRPRATKEALEEWQRKKNRVSESEHAITSDDPFSVNRKFVNTKNGRTVQAYRCDNGQWKVSAYLHETEFKANFRLAEDV